MMNSDTTKKERGWLLPAQKNQDLRPGLYLVATPIGNLGDITLRALDLLSRADLVVCEDKRVTSKLLQAYGIHQKLFVYNDHADAKDRARIFKHIQGGEIVALVSDAGMPLVSDPGYKLVRDCIADGIYVTSLPGANAPLMGLQLSGLPTDGFVFLGFLPAKSAARKKMIEEWRGVSAPLVFFQSPGRLQATLEDLKTVLGDRQACVVRELTKLYEEAQRGSLTELAEVYKESPKGEIVIVVSGADASSAPDEKNLKKQLVSALQEMKTKEAVRFVSENTGVSSKRLYDLALQIKGGA